MTTPPEPLRVALVAGSLGQGGAEKQLVYLARAMRQAGIHISLFSLTRGEFYEKKLADLGLRPAWIGRYNNPLARTASLVHHLRPWRPHLLQSAHYFTNLHVALAARLLGIVSIGSIRSDPGRARTQGQFWNPWLMRLPSSLIANSYTAREHASSAGGQAAKIYVLPNVIDLDEFDQAVKSSRPADAGPARFPNSITPGSISPSQPFTIAVVSRLEPVKRLDLALQAVALARIHAPHVSAVLVGEGSQRSELEKLAGELGLLPGGVRFLGQRADVPAIISQVDLLLLTSQFEGFPNVLLEAMAARVPVITTPAGDAGRVVQDGITGDVVLSASPAEIASRIVQYTQAPEMRRQRGEAGRQRVEQLYSFEGLADRLLSLYREIARSQGGRPLLKILNAYDAQL
jgi:starch synthase (maltosyl-transferring)